MESWSKQPRGRPPRDHGGQSTTLDDTSAYDQDETLRLALTHLVQTVGEAARRVSREFCDAHPQVPWQAVIGMRHKVVHDYMNVDEDILWDTVINELPPLAEELEKMLPSEGGT